MAMPFKKSRRLGVGTLSFFWVSFFSLESLTAIPPFHFLGWRNDPKILLVNLTSFSQDLAAFIGNKKGGRSSTWPPLHTGGLRDYSQSRIAQLIP
jgi:hypothetical protein